MTLAQRLALLKGNRNLNPNANGIEDDIADGRTDTYRDEPKDGTVRAAPSSEPASAMVPLVARLQRLYLMAGTTVRQYILAGKTKRRRGCRAPAR